MSVNINELFKGVAVIIDDEINNADANINRIVAQIDSLNIPMLKYNTIPSNEIISNFHNVSFILLDWKLFNGQSLTEDQNLDARIPQGLLDYNKEQNIQFIKQLYFNCFCPIFIFSNENISEIEIALTKNKIYEQNKPSNILIKDKTSLKNKNSLKNTLEQWIKKNSVVYVLKEWEREYQKSKNNLFLEFYKMSPIWPKVMWKCFEEDQVNRSFELGELITRNLHTRMKPFNFEGTHIKGNCSHVKVADLRKILEGTLYLRKTSLHDDEIEPGDLFKKDSKYFLNIRAACDLIPGGTENIDDVELYLIEGSKLSQKQTEKYFSKKYGNFNESYIQSIIFPLENKALDFRFKKMTIEKWRDVKNNRTGRILPPYITKIQQRYAFYQQRQGIPRIPLKATKKIIL